MVRLNTSARAGYCCYIKLLFSPFYYLHSSTKSVLTFESNFWMGNATVIDVQTHIAVVSMHVDLTRCTSALRST